MQGPWWHLPGGLIEQDEPPSRACQREIREELGLELPPGPLFVVGWNPPRRPGSRAQFTFVFDMGVHVADDLAERIRLQHNELLNWQWLRPHQARTLLHPDIADRLDHAHATRPSAAYHEATPQPGPEPQR
ncbi:hypothetical protein GCM10009545_05050 [Saccharopolyspora thermophila]|uniref:Nudix hydrolase domain-containing protein n=1 Tax=Saccharopolyspora thermophila TaxID=89367 RepID=A0ABP3LSG5_9PSEU